MRKKDVIRRLKDVLQKRRTALRKSLTNDIADLKRGTGIEKGDVADVALDDAFDLVSSQLAESESRELAQIELALERIRRGTYTQCGVCEGAIPLARLEALPYAVRCVKCEREAEKKRRLGASDDRWSGVSGVEDDSEPHNPFMDHVADIF
jgi:DnaK suppressor protein